MKNCNKIKHTCGNKNYATCIDYETELPEFSEIEGCANLEETTTELYTQVGNILNEIDLSELGEQCLEYTLTEEGKKVVKNVLLKYETEICELKEKINILETTEICNKDITACNLDFGNLTLPCDVQPQTLGETLQLILNTLNTP